jgi:hypothetical protein
MLSLQDPNVELFGLKTLTVPFSVPLPYRFSPSDSPILIAALRRCELVTWLENVSNLVPLYATHEAQETEFYLSTFFNPEEFWFCGKSWEAQEFYPDEWVQGRLHRMNPPVLDTVLLTNVSTI